MQRKCFDPNPCFPPCRRAVGIGSRDIVPCGGSGQRPKVFHLYPQPVLRRRFPSQIHRQLEMILLHALALIKPVRIQPQPVAADLYLYAAPRLCLPACLAEQLAPNPAAPVPFRHSQLHHLRNTPAVVQMAFHAQIQKTNYAVFRTACRSMFPPPQPLMRRISAPIS